MSEPTDKQIDAGANALRKFEQSDKKLLEWERLPISVKRKWLIKAQIVLEAAESARGG